MPRVVAGFALTLSAGSRPNFPMQKDRLRYLEFHGDAAPSPRLVRVRGGAAADSICREPSSGEIFGPKRGLRQRKRDITVALLRAEF